MTDAHNAPEAGTDTPPATVASGEARHDETGFVTPVDEAEFPALKVVLTGEPNARLVREQASDDWLADQQAVDNVKWQRVVGRKDSRRAVTIVNVPVAAGGLGGLLLIARSESNNARVGSFPLAVGASITLRSRHEVWAQGGDATGATVGIIEEFDFAE